MMKRGSKAAVMIVLMLTFLFLSVYESDAVATRAQKNILVLHSYNEEQDWTRGLTSGIIDTIRKANKNYFVSVEHMDWKNYPTAENLDHLYQYYRLKYDEKPLDVIIACDDAALSFALKNRAELFSDAPVVFCGVNKESMTRIDNNKYSNYTGVYEIADPTGSVEMACSINPELEKIYLVSDNTESGTTTAKLFIEKIEAMDRNFQIIRLNYLEFNELLIFLSKLDDRSIVLYATYNSDAAGNILEYNIALKQICQSSTAPVYHMYDFGLNDGIFGGNLTSPKLYGEYAADMAIRILQGEKADQIKILTLDAANKIVDYSQMEKYGILPESIPEDVKIINRPFSFFETYKTLVLVVLMIFTFLVSLVIVLWVYSGRITKMKRELAVLALHDVLTGLPNRRSLFQDASGLFLKSGSGQSALLYIDMDNFKYINDTMGHGFGDEFIKKVSERLLKSLTENCIMYRLSGDEFIILLQGIKNDRETEDFVRKVQGLFDREFEVYNTNLKISASVGVALYPDHGNTIDELVKSADIAMFKAKEAGKNRYIIYEIGMNDDFSNRMILEKHLHSAMKNNEFELYYQPQVNADTGTITGMEALLRWNSPELGMVPPLKFIPVAEVTNLIVPLGEWVLKQACDFLSGLHRGGHPELNVSVNISIIQILQADFTDRVIKILELYDIDPEYLELEITETVLIESFDSVLDKLRLLHERGIRIALDDFGKGYSSLNYLMRLPISTLKIDKSFVDNIFINEGYKEIACHIISMGKALGVTIVAEGVENEDQLEYLKKYRCDKIQGYLFSRPVTENVMRDML